MEEIQKSATHNSNGCINCGNPAIVNGYPNALCENCRESLIKFPVPKGIILFAASIGLIFLFSIYKIPRDILLGIHLDKAKTALEGRKYLSAQKELQKVVEKIPDNLEARSNLLIAALNNEDFVTFNKMYIQLSGEQYSDQELYGRVEYAVKRAEKYFPSDSFAALQRRYDSNVYKIPDAELRKYMEKYPDEPYPSMVMANRLTEAKSFIEADSVVVKILDANPTYVPALDMMTVLKREENKPAESLAYCEKILGINAESVFALASKARTFLKQKKDVEAMALAQQCHRMDENNYYATATLIMAYHFTNKLKERDDLLNKISLLKDTASEEITQYVRDIISGKESFRN